MKLNGKAITCWRCNGHGVVQTWPNIPDECPECNGSGKLWQYRSGVVAKYYSGPLLGRLAFTAAAMPGEDE